jgi:hypothetical protein
MNSLFLQKDSLFLLSRESWFNALELLHEIDRGIAELAGIFKIPCYFPC